MNESEKALLALATAVLSGEKPGSELVRVVNSQIEEHGLRVTHFPIDGVVYDFSIPPRSEDDDPEILLHEYDCARDRLYEAVNAYNELREHGHGIMGAYYALKQRQPDVPALQEILDLRAELSRQKYTGG